ncbi:MAG: hypothetical protein AMQ22_02020 [Candidatus Methanofastidiosum methylothiophilum]|uniref:Uncharacterized protein n=1 Tax=Candidatus Methanofastidiosum methylothiophilum TaxID=1705564 RepID=A0A150IPW4_9EURY|nr:MAG: hypothetical protein AMQ22_02020 [Candidatus Methanofastidiosum methylthiophilus]
MYYKKIKENQNDWLNAILGFDIIMIIYVWCLGQLFNLEFWVPILKLISIQWS